MFRNYLKIAWRNLSKTKGYSAINIGGLAVGMAVAMIIGMSVFDELDYNKYHKNYSTIAQVYESGRFNGQGQTSSSLPRPLEFELRNKYGDNFKHIVMSRYNESHILAVGEKAITKSGRFMQQAAPELLSLNILSGTPSGLKDPYSIMLSASTANALFGDEDPVDKLLKLDNETSLKVTGVYEDIPYNSEFRDLNFLAPWDLMLTLQPWMNEAKDQWGNHSFLMYVQINPNTSFEAVSQRIKTSMADNVEDGKKFNREVFLYPMSRWHLYNEWKNGVNVGGYVQYVWMFGTIGVFVLLLACINFMNLSTARSEKRAKEVGIRKAIGSRRHQLIKQFLSESLLVVVIAFIIAILLVSLSLPWYNELSDKKMTMMWFNGYFWMASIVFIIFTSIISGSYPAFFLSSFQPVKVLKGTFNAGPASSLPRQILVVLQFTVSVSLMIGTIIVYNQLQHGRNRPVGYERNGLLMIHINSKDLMKKYELLATELGKEKVISSIARSSSPVTSLWDRNGGLEWEGKDPNKIDNFGTIEITHDFGKTVGWEFIGGRDFSRSIASDSVGGPPVATKTYNMILNEAAVNYMELKKPVGAILHWDGIPVRVIGVIKDMVMESPYSPVKPSIFFVSYEGAKGWINIRIHPDADLPEALSKMEAIFKRIVPGVPFEYKFSDTEYDMKFRTQARIGHMTFIFSILAIVISSLGLFGLASFVAERRTKEIGIRKILGASLFNLWRMLSREFIVLVAISSLIAIPLAYYYLHQWLQNYEYRITISWWVFAAAVGGALVITLLTVSFQAIKVGIRNPVKSLRQE